MAATMATKFEGLSTVLGNFITGQGTSISAVDAQSFVDKIIEALPEVLPGIEPAPSQALFPDGDPIGAVFAYNAPSAALRFLVVSPVAAGPLVFGFKFDRPIAAGVRLPVQVVGRQSAGAWDVEVTFDTLTLLRQLGVRVLGRPVPV